MGQHINAIKDYTSALTIDPANAFAYYNRGISYDTNGHLQEAIQDFERASSLQPQNADFMHNLALCYRKLGRYQEAVSAYGACLQLCPDHRKALHGRGVCLEKLHFISEALQDFRALLALQPDHTACLISLGQLLLHFYKDDRERLQECTRLFATALTGLCPSGEYETIVQGWLLPHITPNDTLPGGGRGITRHAHTTDNGDGHSNGRDNKGNRKKTSSVSEGVYRQAIDVLTALYGRARAHCDLGNTNMSINDLSVCVQLIALFRRCGVDRAAASAMSTAPGLCDVYSTRGLCYKTMGHYDKAIADYESVITELQSNSTGTSPASSQGSRSHSTLTDPSRQTLLVETYNFLGFCLRKMDRYAEAISAYGQAVRTDPSHIRGYNNRAYCFAKCGSYDEAIADYSSVIRLDDRNAHAYHNRGISLDKMGRFDEAIADFAKVFACLYLSECVSIYV